MQRVRHCWTTRLFQPFLQNRQSLVQRHAGLQQMRKLLSENEQLAVVEFSGFSQAWRLRASRAAAIFVGTAAGALLFAFHGLKPASTISIRIGMQCCDSICRIAMARSAQSRTPSLTALRVARAISKLWHRRGKSNRKTLNRKLESSLRLVNK